ncbi:MAG: substrate-binding domain-containing protein [Planctomycetota bacterium]
MKKPLIAVIVVAVLIALIAVLLPGEEPELRLYAGAGLRRAVHAAVAAFHEQTGIKVVPDYGGSGLMITRAREDDTADLFLPGDVWYVDRYEKLTGRKTERAPVAYFIPTLIVAKDNPKNITGLADLTKPGVTVGLGKADACQVGRISARILRNAGVEPADLETQESLTVNELGVWVQTNAVDAAIVWDAIAANIADDVETIPIPPEHNIISRVVLAILPTTTRRADARKFLEFLSAPHGQTILENNGFRTDLPEGYQAER